MLFFCVDDGFVDPSKKPKDWARKMWVSCGKAKAWDPPTIPVCMDKRGCQTPPLRNDKIWGSFEDSPTQNLELGSTYWYACREGKLL